MIKNRKPHLATVRMPLVLALATAPLAAAPVAADPVTEAIKNGEASLSARYRYEFVDQATIPNDAHASTLKTKLGYRTGKVSGFSGFLEAESVTAIGSENFASPTNNVTNHPVVADPTETEINQAYLRYQGLADTDIKYGRQLFTLDNHRFVGHVGWRQNEQTYDAATVVNQSLADTTLTAGYIHNVNRIFSEAAGAAGDHGMQSGIFNARYDGLSAGSLTAYSYLLDYDSVDTNSTSSYGLRFTGGTDLSDNVRGLYTLEYAQQSDYADNPNSFDVDYYRVEGGASVSGVTLKLGQEMLGSDDGNAAFQTPLATLHAMNGWTDKFLGTPANGLVDTYASIGGKAGDIKLMAIHHQFESDTANQDYGTETGVLATKPLNETYTLGFKAASYSADDFSVDTDKAWLWVQASF
ncbi:alginate export protein [Halospina denitrificans]|uniref:Alginate export protein n=1 Tax=Halospina denitrificans TaxID=332522 RepID=A0A4R7JKK3_9GAMM|nr:alginate export family protein [Halospina denitrificans]TDT38531.1 alginate export protein [Halospina denitrificans]